MPCYDPPHGATAVEVQQAVNNARLEFRHNSEVAQMLCEVLQHIERVTGPHMPTALEEFSPELQQWWAEHKQRDANR